MILKNKMKILLLIPFLGSPLLAYEQKTTLGLEERVYNSYNNDIVASGKSELSFKNDYFNTNIEVEFLLSSEFQERRYFLFNELYLSKEFDTFAFSLGKKIKYWGELEGYNIADVYNQKNYLKDPFDKDSKLGTIGVDITRYFGDNSVEVGAKFYEQYIRYPKKKSPYAPFSIEYDEELSLAEDNYTPTLYAKMNFLSSESVDSETSIILLKGYDTKRYYKPTLVGKLKQQAYKVNKVLFLSHIIYEDTIFKTEMSYTDLVEDSNISAY